MVSTTNIEPNISGHIPQPPHGGDPNSLCSCLPCWWVRPRPLIPPSLAEAFDSGFCFPSTHVPGCMGDCHIPRATADDSLIRGSGPGLVLPLADLIDSFLRHKVNRGVKPGSLKTYKNASRRSQASSPRFPTASLRSWNSWVDSTVNLGVTARITRS